MSEVLIQAIGQIVSGDFAAPLLDGDSIRIRDGLIVEIGSGLAAGAPPPWPCLPPAATRLLPELYGHERPPVGRQLSSKSRGSG